MEDQGSARIKEIKKHLNLKVDDLHAYFLSNIKDSKFSNQAFDKKLQVTLKKHKTPDHFNQLSFILEIKNIIHHSQDIESIPTNILGLNAFKKFETCHLIVHEKGKPFGTNYSSNISRDFSHKTIAAKNFNALFSTTKKSKLKNFIQSDSFKNDLDLVGNFMAKEIELKKHNALVILSRNSFLAPTSLEWESFYFLATQVAIIITDILDKMKINDNKELIIKALKLFPENITIKDHNRVIFSNTPPSSITNSRVKNIYIPELQLQLLIANEAKENVTTELYHAQRVALLGELLNTLQHELSNPLFGLSLTSELLLSDCTNQEASELIEHIKFNSQRSQTIIKNFSNLYNSESNAIREINLYQIVEESLTLTKSDSKEIPKIIEPEDLNRLKTIKIKTNPTYLSQIIFNLIINASQAIKSLGSHSNSKGIIKISFNENANFYEINISDTGPGIPSQIEDKIFNPFFTTKSTGTGLGLSICKKLAQNIHADITFKNNSPFPGATFSLKLFK